MVKKPAPKQTKLDLPPNLPVHIVGIRSRGQTYFYARRSAWVNGSSKVVWSLSLGTARDIVAKYQQPESSLDHLKLRTFEFGKAAALHTVAKELGFFEAVDLAVGQEATTHLTTAQVMFAVIAGRAHGPYSKSGTGRWYGHTFLNPMWAGAEGLGCQTFLDHMDRLTPQAVDDISLALGKRLVELGVSPTAIFWDLTNFSTCMDQWDEDALVRPGNAKDKRFDKNIFGLGVAASDDAIPLVSATVPGNAADATVFKQAIHKIADRLRELSVEVEKMVLVMDRGNNSPGNIGTVLDMMHLIGGLRKSEAADLMEVPLSEFRFLYKTNHDGRMSGHRTKRTVHGREMVVIVTHNTATEKRQRRTWEKSRRKIEAGMKDLAIRYARKEGPGRKMTLRGLTREIHDLVPRQYRAAVDFDVDQANRLLTWRFDAKKEEAMRRGFGKSVLFTDLADWKTEKIVKTYHRKWVLEEDFKWMHQKILLPVTPVFHHADSEQRIRVHVFLCVVGMVFMRYLTRKLALKGVSPREIWDELGRLRVILAKDKRTGKARFVVEEMTAVQAQVFERLGFARYLASG